MFIIKFFAIFAAISCVLGFQPIRVSRKVELSMSASKQPSFFKSAGIALLGASLFGSPVFAKEGAGAKFSFFGADVASSPFTVNENREDPMYSPYSAYGDGTAAVYNGRRGGNEEKSFYAAKFAEAS